ncbi:MAG: hypothetical protein K8J09_19970 [Planctomycetes bacterium]|nr:hypothetical protein [Planctomycetota bacterium]
MSKIDYKQAGVDYGKIDPLKILAQRAAAATAGNLQRHGLTEIAASRGESAYLVDCGDFLLASITECLGTKALVADATRQLTGRTYYDLIAQDTLAMAINDLITVGAYQAGADPLLDTAVQLYPAMEKFLQQRFDQRESWPQAVAQLTRLFGDTRGLAAA